MQEDEEEEEEDVHALKSSGQQETLHLPEVSCGDPLLHAVEGVTNLVRQKGKKPPLQTSASQSCTAVITKEVPEPGRARGAASTRQEPEARLVQAMLVHERQKEQLRLHRAREEPRQAEAHGHQRARRDATADEPCEG